jgi:hypothetical protein
MAHTDPIIVRLLRIADAVPAVDKAGWNDHTKKNFIQLDDILKVLRPLFQEQGLTLVQVVTRADDGTPVLESQARDNAEGNHWIIGSMELPRIADVGPQKVGSCITYARRYTIVPFFGITDQKDDDGHMGQHGKEMPQGSPPANSPTNNPDTHADAGEALRGQFAARVRELLPNIDAHGIAAVCHHMNVNPKTTDPQTWNYALGELARIGGGLAEWLEQHQQENQQ